jgi:cell division protease FtsH
MNNNKNKKDKEYKIIKLSIMYILIAVVLIYLYQGFFGAKRETVLYSTFKEFVAQDRIKSCRVSEKYIKGVYIDKSGETRDFVTIPVKDPKLTDELIAHGVKFEGVPSADWLTNLIFGWVIPFGILFLLWFFIIKKAGTSGKGLFSFGKGRYKIYSSERPNVKFNDVAGVEEAKIEVGEIIEFLRDPHRFQRLGGKMPKGVLLVGAPGTGKTLLARATAGEAEVPFISITGSAFIELFVGVGAARVRDLFAEAKKLAPSIIFIDEIDAIGRTRGAGGFTTHEEREQTLNQLLAEMDGFDPSRGIVVIAATNRPEVLDPALLRPGRFDRQILVDKPDIKGREEILRLHAKKIVLGENVDLKVIAQETPGLVGADLANIVNEAALLAARENVDKVYKKHFEEAIDRRMAGLAKKNKAMSPKEKKTVAYHESGHAIVGYLLKRIEVVHKVSIIPRGVAALGFTQQRPTEEHYLMRKSEILDKICMLFGGRVAEEIVFGDVSTGAQNDLYTATELARAVVTQFGMSDELGPVVYERERQPIFLPTPFSPKETYYSQNTSEAIDRETRKIIDYCYNKSQKLLLENRSKLDKLAQRLLEKEIVDEKELNEIMESKDDEEIKTSPCTD